MIISTKASLNKTATGVHTTTRVPCPSGHGLPPSWKTNTNSKKKTHTQTLWVWLVCSSYSIYNGGKARPSKSLQLPSRSLDETVVTGCHSRVRKPCAGGQVERNQKPAARRVTKKLPQPAVPYPATPSQRQRGHLALTKRAQGVRAQSSMLHSRAQAQAGKKNTGTHANKTHDADTRITGVVSEKAAETRTSPGRERPHIVCRNVTGAVRIGSQLIFAELRLRYVLRVRVRTPAWRLRRGEERWTAERMMNKHYYCWLYCPMITTLYYGASSDEKKKK